MGEDIIDFTMLQKKGILQRVKDLERQSKSISQSSSNDGFVDLTKMGNLNNSVSLGKSEDSGSFNSGGNSGGFAGFFGAVDSGISGTSETSGVSSVGSMSASSSDSDISALRIKLDDTDFKLQRALERIDELEKKVTEMKV